MVATHQCWDVCIYLFECGTVNDSVFSYRGLLFVVPAKYWKPGCLTSLFHVFFPRSKHWLRNPFLPLREFASGSPLEDYCLSREDLQPHCKKLVRSRFVPIIHNIKTPKLHEAARELLPLAEKRRRACRESSLSSGVPSGVIKHGWKISQMMIPPIESSIAIDIVVGDFHRFPMSIFDCRRICQSSTLRGGNLARERSS